MQTRVDNEPASAQWPTVAEIPGFPFESFEQLQAAVAYRSFSIGVDSFAAARWSEAHDGKLNRAVVTLLSLVLVLAAIASVIAAFWSGRYLLLAALPIQALAFYLSHPSSPFRRWVTLAGVATIILFLEMLLYRMPVAAVLVAYAGLTFAAVRAAGYLNNSAFRDALVKDEALFLEAYGARACTIRNKGTGRVYSAGES